MPKVFISFVALMIIFSCRKTTTDKSCGCSSDITVIHIALNDSVPYQAWLIYVTQKNLNAWFITVLYSNSNYSALCRICNPDLPEIRAFTDTSSKKYSIPIRVQGEVKAQCDNEVPQFGLTVLPETYCGHIVVDSIKRAN